MTVEFNQLHLNKMMDKWEEEIRKHPIRVKLRDTWICVKNYINSIPRRIKSFIQRGIRGWADCDTWGFDTYLAKVISGGVKHLRDTKVGFHLIENMSEEQLKKEWENILNKIIKTFKIAERISNSDIWYIPSKEWTETEYNEVLKRLKKEEILTKQESIEYEEGFDLLKKHFHSLWN